MGLVALGGWAVLALALDQATKHLALGRLHGAGPRRVARGVRLRPVTNARGGLLRLSNSQASALFALVLVVAVAVVRLEPDSRLLASGLGLVLGGAAGNLADRLARGAVVDFIAVGRWPVFNVADAALTLGVALTGAGLL